MTDQISHANHCILINTSEIFHVSQRIESIKGIKDYTICKINWDALQLKNNLNRLIKIFKSEDEFNYNTKDDLYLIFFEVVNNDVKILIDHNNVLNASAGLVQLINIIKSKFSKNKYCLTSSNLQSFAIKTLFNLNGDINNETIINLNDDLIGSKSWISLSFLFDFLNKYSSWLILRNFEDLNDSYLFEDGDDIDILCEEINFFSALMNAKKRSGERCSYFVTVNNFEIPLDIRFIGDKYYDPVWSKDMLIRKVITNGIPTPCQLDYFYSLLYHTKLQKNFVKPSYIERLDNLAIKMDFLLPKHFILDDSICSGVLNSFLKTYNYYYTYTDDAGRNETFLNNIDKKEINDLLSNWRVLIKASRVTFLKKIKEVFTRNISKLKLNANKTNQAINL
ncbi:hypothetical protein N8131_07960 [Flavobacteriaceae bacterium]|nr:hypothetical protein [Flavobacteriaceae bacterium]